MNKHALYKLSVAALLMALLAFHIFHLYGTWKSSKMAVVAADYSVPPGLNAGMRAASQQMEQILVNRLKQDSQLADEFGLGAWPNYDANIIHVSFALRNPKLEPEPILRLLAVDFQKTILNSMPPPVSATRNSSSNMAAETASPNLNEQPAELKLISLNTRYPVGIKPLDILSLAVLIIAIFVWLRGGSEGRSQ